MVGLIVDEEVRAIRVVIPEARTKLCHLVSEQVLIGAELGLGAPETDACHFDRPDCRLEGGPCNVGVRDVTPSERSRARR